MSSLEIHLWMAAYVAVLSIRLHPRNDEDLTTVRRAAVDAANYAVEDFRDACELGSDS